MDADDQEHEQQARAAKAKPYMAMKTIQPSQPYGAMVKPAAPNHKIKKRATIVESPSHIKK